ncbi:MAG: SBBP repeat-containing protein, partial [Chitinophagales bacterium]|nr:SBBP repeat-containing protein [Chitinophagales bacterium]
MKKIYFSIAFALVILNINCSIAQKQITGNHVSPKVFIENKGQITDQFGNKNSEVQFLYHNGIFNLELKKDGFSYEIFEVQHSSTNFSEAGNNSFGNEEHPDLKVTANRIDVQFEGCNTNATIEATEKIDGYYNFYYAPVNTNRLNRVNAFRKITYKNIYDGIDLTFISPNEKSVTTAAGLPFQNKKPVPLRYEFTVHPGADLSKIKFSYHGAEKLLVNADGNFEATAASSFVNESKPKYFVEGSAVPIEANFEMHNNIKSFSSLEYDHSKFLIIDPNIIWGSYFGGEGGDEDSEIAVDDEGNPVIDGQSFSYEHIATIGAYQTTYNGGVYDWFISKFTTTGELIWSTYFGGDDKDYCYGLEIDHNKNIIAVGNSISKGLATTGAFKDSITGKAADILIAKFSPDGQLLWSTYMGGDSSENARNVVCDSKNDLYLVGTSLSITGIASAGAYQENNGGYDDAWIAKFSQSGDRLWSTFFGDSGVDRSHALTLNSTGFIYMAGTTSSKKGIASTGAHQIVYGGGSEDAFLSKFDSTGQLLWATYYGGALDDRSRGVETDSLGFIYVGGFTNSANNIGTAGTWQPNWAVGYQDNIPTEDAFVAKFNSAGQRKWGTYLGGDNVENLWGMTIDKASKSIYLVGSTTSPFYLSYGSAMQISKSDAADCFISKFTTTGDLAWSTYWGGQVGDQFEDVAVDKNKFIYTCGRAVANDYAVTQDAYQMNFYG